MGSACTSQSSANVLQGDSTSFKMVLVGDAEVGKTAVFMRYTKNQFDYSYQPTVSVCIGNVVKKVNVPDDGIVSVAVWDLPGREEVDLRRSYYKDIDAAIVVVDVSDTDSINSASMWKQDILSNCDTRLFESNLTSTHTHSFSIPILLLGNKLDQLNYNVESEEIPKEVLLLEKLVDEQGFAGGAVVSARDGDGSVHDAVQTLIRHLLEMRKSRQGMNMQIEKRVSMNRVVFRSELYKRKKRLPVSHVPQFDQLFEQSEQGITDIEWAVSKFNSALSRFRKQCAVADIGLGGQPTLEDCITALKKAIGDQHMKLDQEVLFPQLIVSSQIEKEVVLQVWTAIEIYQNEVVSTAERVLSVCPIAESLLCGLYEELVKLQDQSWDLCTAAGLTKKATREAVFVIKANVDEIKQTRNTATKGVQAVERSTQKVQAAMMW